MEGEQKIDRYGNEWEKFFAVNHVADSIIFYATEWPTNEQEKRILTALT